MVCTQQNTQEAQDKRLLCLSYRFPPESYPVATRVEYILDHLDDWHIDAITAAEDGRLDDHVTPHHVPCPTPTRLLSALRKVRLNKLVNWLVWPDASLFWAVPAYLKARALLRQHQYDAIVVFMMPFGAGLAGVVLKKQTGLPLVLNFDDSLTCSDLFPDFPSRLHYEAAKKLENLYVRTSDASIYVSRRNMDRVRARQPREHHSKFHLVRWGSEPLPSGPSPSPDPDTFRIVYTGGTSGWYRFLQHDSSSSILKRTYRAWKQAGRYKLTDLDYRTHGPIYVGLAIRDLLERHPEWEGRLCIDVYGKRYPESVTEAVLHKYGLEDIVHLHGLVPHETALQKMLGSDLLFMALPDRPDGSPGARISAKTYEYLMTERPILAALPPGENREYLQDKPGVHLVPPSGIEEMEAVIEPLVTDTFAGQSVAVDRSQLRSSLSSEARAASFARVLEQVATQPDPETAVAP